MLINGVEYTDEELLDINYKTCLQVITQTRQSHYWRTLPDKGKLMTLKWFIDCGLEMKPEDVYKNCKEYFDGEKNEQR